MSLAWSFPLPITYCTAIMGYMLIPFSFLLANYEKHASVKGQTEKLISLSHTSKRAVSRKKEARTCDLQCYELGFKVGGSQGTNNNIFQTLTDDYRPIAMICTSLASFFPGSTGHILQVIVDSMRLNIVTSSYPTRTDIKGNDFYWLKKKYHHYFLTNSERRECNIYV